MNYKTKTVKIFLSLMLVASIFSSIMPISATRIVDVAKTSEFDSNDSEKFKAPDIIDEEEQEEKSYIGRVKEDEKDLYTFIFKNEDGSNTMRVFDHPVKYIDDKGETRDISLEISKDKDGTFKAADHMIKASFGNDISEGIGFEYDDVRIEMVAKAENNVKTKAGLSADGKKLTYVVDDKTSYVYSLTYCGIKEDIVVNEYTGQTEYEFILKTNGLHPVKIDESVFLADNDEEIKASIGDIIIFTTDNRNNAFGDLQFETVEENSEYMFTIVLDPDYLRDEKTAYPITIDPTIEINYDNNGAGAIEDVTINSLDTSSGSSGSIYVGLRNPYGISRILMRFPNLNLSEIASDNDIISAKVEIRDLLCESEEMWVYCYIFNGGTWSESSVDWQTVSPNSYTTFLSSKKISYNEGHALDPMYRYSFDILAAVKRWKDGTADKLKGIIFKASSSVEGGSTYINKTFASYNRASNQPSLTVEYNAKISINYTELYLNEGNTITLSATTHPSNLAVSWSSSNTSAATVNSSGIVTGISAKATPVTITATASINGETCSSTCQIYVTIENGVYYIKNQKSGYYLTVENGGISNKTDVIQTLKYGASSAETDKITQMWKIKHLGYGRYSVRPMHKLNMGLNVTSANVDINTIGTTDILYWVNNYAEWTIERYSNSSSGCIFKNDGSSSKAAHVSGGSTSSNETIVAGTYSSTTDYRWNLERINDVPTGIVLYNTTNETVLNNPIATINPSDTKTLSQLNFTIAFFSETSISQTFYWYSGNANIVSINSSTGTITGITNGIATVTARKYYSGQYYYCHFTVKVNNNGVIIIPGIMGTELIAGHNNSSYSYGTTLWSESLETDLLNGQLDILDVIQRVVSLKCNSNGESNDDIIPYDNTYGAANIYESLYNQLYNEYHDNYAIRFFAYDWRLSNAVSANRLNDFIINNNFDNVILVCHSMGGLVASKYLSLGSSQRDIVETVIMIGSPLLGTSVVPYLWGSEDVNVTGLLDNIGVPSFGKWLIDKIALYYNPLDHLIGNFSSMYEMFPTEMYFDNSYAGKTYLTISIGPISDLEITSYSDTKLRLQSYLPCYNSTLVSAAENFHNSLYINSTHVTELVNTFYIAGYNSQTIDHIKYNLYNWSILSNTVSGDQMVATWSATLGDRQTSKTFFVNGIDHVSLVTNYNVRSFIIQLINGNTSTSLYNNISANM